jgi:N-acetylneuraminic acid mutarotase
LSTAERSPEHGGPGPPRRPPPSPAIVRRRRAVALAVIVALLVLILSLALAGGSSRKSSATARSKASRAAAAERAPARFSIRTLPLTLPVALQDAAAAPLQGQQFVLLGGLEAGEGSTAAVAVLDAGRVIARASLPEPQHDAQAARLGGMVYVFGGGQESSYNHILRFDPATTSVTQAGELPQATSDAAVAEVGETAYVIGGYNGQQALDTIVAWRPGGSAEVVAHLPSGLRYGAAAAASGGIVIAGGTPGEGANSAILRFDPATRALQSIGQMPAPVEHASAFALGRYVYVVGGRGAAQGSQTADLIAIDSTSGHAVRIAQLPQPLSDAAVTESGGHVWVAGGSSTSGVAASILELEPLAP